MQEVGGGRGGWGVGCRKGCEVWFEGRSGRRERRRGWRLNRTLAPARGKGASCQSGEALECSGSPADPGWRKASGSPPSRQLPLGGGQPGLPPCAALLVRVPDPEGCRRASPTRGFPRPGSDGGWVPPASPHRLRAASFLLPPSSTSPHPHPRPQGGSLTPPGPRSPMLFPPGAGGVHLIFGGLNANLRGWCLGREGRRGCGTQSGLKEDRIIQQIITVCKTLLSVAVGDPVERASGLDDFGSYPTRRDSYDVFDLARFLKPRFGAGV